MPPTPSPRKAWQHPGQYFTGNHFRERFTAASFHGATTDNGSPVLEYRCLGHLYPTPVILEGQSSFRAPPGLG